VQITPGTRLGPYEIVAPIGAGGMGEVYRAKDTKLNRDVAIKVLPESFALDADRVARFTREAQVLASLNHPNIAQIYAVETTSGVVSPRNGNYGEHGNSSFRSAGETTPEVVSLSALVMELVEGEDLSAHINRGAIPLAEALPIAKQIADALEAAHEQGIVHRDLKPQNIKVRGDGTVKVLDFGLAKASDPSASSSSNVANSPTMTSPAMTGMGMILGTAAYMSPEQAKGRAVDKRADIWAFGAVLYEMLTGTRAFKGEDVSDVLVSVLRDTPDLSALPADTPASVRRLIARCLERDLKRRLRDIGEARLILEDPAALAPDAVPVSSAVSLTPPPPPLWRRALPWALTCVLAVALIVLWAPWRSMPTPMPRRLLASIGADASLVTSRGASAILSPDGTTLVFAALQDSQTRLFIRKLDQLQAAPLAGTEGAAHPFFSPDGQWIAFFAGDKLKKVSAAGGAAVNLCDVVAGRGGTWVDDDTIIFSPSSAANTALLRVPVAGGKPTAFGTLSQGGNVQRWPQALPGGKAVLYTEHSSIIGFEGANIIAALVSTDASAKAGPAKVVVSSAYYGRYVPSGLGRRSLGEGGHLIYIQQGTLFAMPFDPVRLEPTGPAVPAIEGLASSGSSGGAQVDFSREGTLAYVPGAVTSNILNPIDWMTRDGKTSVLRATKSYWSGPRFSPDGQKLAIEITDGKRMGIWVYDWARDTPTQLTFGTGRDTNPVWTLDGKRIVFASDRAKPGGPRNLYWVNADGTGAVTRLTDSPDDERPTSWHPGGRLLAFTAAHSGTLDDLMILPMEGDAAKGWTAGKPTAFLSTPASENQSMFSPDGRFIAYSSNEAGDNVPVVYVRQFAGPGKWRVSASRGNFPRWSAETHDLLWVDQGQDKLMAVPFSVVGGAFVAGKPQLWSPMSLLPMASSPYDLHPDGKRIVMAPVQGQGAAQDHVVLMSNFFDYLRKIAPVKK